MLIRLIDTLQNLKYRRRYPGLVVGHHAAISEDSRFGEGSTVGDFVTIRSSHFGADADVVDRSVVTDSRCGDRVRLVNAQVHGSTLESHVAIYNGCQLSGVTVEQYSYFSLGSLVSMASFGRFCSVGPYLLCGHGNHPTNYPSTSPVFFSPLRQCGLSFTGESHFEERAKVEVGHDVWIGARVYLRDGVKVGNGAIIAAGSVVVKDVPDYAIVGGIPAKLIRYRFDETTIARLLDLRWWDWPEDRLREAQPFFIKEDLSDLFAWAESAGLSQ